MNGATRFDWRETGGSGERREEAEIYLSRGNACKRAGQFGKAIDWFTKVLEIAEKQRDVEQQTNAYLELGYCCKWNSEIGTAVEYYEKALESAKKGNNKEKEIDALVELGHAYRLKRELQKANQYSQEALHLAKEQGDIRRANMAMDAIEKLPSWISYKKVRLPTRGNTADLQTSHATDAAQLHAAQEEIVDNAEQEEIACESESDETGIPAGQEEIVDCAEEEEIACESESDERRILAEQLLNSGLSYQTNGKIEEAIKNYKEAVEIADAGDHDDIKANAYQYLGNIYTANFQYKECIKYYKKAARLAFFFRDQQNKISAYLGLGNAFSYKCEYKSSRKYFSKALKVAEKIQDKVLQKEAHTLLGHVYYSSCKFDAAAKSFLKAHEISHNLGDRNEEADIYLLLGDTFLQLKQHEEATDFFQKAIDISKELESAAIKTRAIEGLGTVYLTLASVCCKDCDYETAIKWYKKIKALNLAGTEFSESLELLQEKTLTGLGLAWFNLGDNEKAIKFIQEARKFVKKETDTDCDDVGVALPDLHNVENTDENINCTEQTASPSQTPGENVDKTSENVVIFQESDPEFKGERVDALIEDACNPSRTERLPTEDLVRLQKCIKEFSASYVYTHRASSKDPLNDNVRKSMTRNVKSSAYTNLLSLPEKSKNDGKFVDADQQIINIARDDLTKNQSTKMPAILLRRLGPYIKSIGRISCGSKAGTCWLVTNMMVLTCHHVYSLFIEERTAQRNPNLPVEVSFDCFDARRPEEVRKVEVDEEHDPEDPELESSCLDYKLLRLRENEALTGRNGLGPIVRNRSLQEGLVIIVGHPAGSEEMQQETCVVVRNQSWREQLQQRHHRTGLHMTNDDRLRANSYQERGCLPYDTTLFSGASGSPVFDMNGNIVAMHTQGYTLNVQGAKCSLMEFGVQFNAICEDMKRRNIVVEQYFPDYNLENHEERMDIDN